MADCGGPRTAVTVPRHGSGVMRFDWSSVEFIINSKVGFPMTALTDSNAKVNVRDFRHFRFSEFQKLTGFNEFFWRNASPNLLKISNENMFHVMLKRFVQQGGKKTYNIIEITTT